MAAKLLVGFRTNSLAVIGDGLDTATDVVIAGLALGVSGIIARPADAGHPWGHGRAELTATILLSFAIFYAGASLGVQALHKVRSPTEVAPPALISFGVTLFSIAGKLLLSLSQSVLGKRAGSPLILANAKNMRGDVLISASVLLGLGLSRLFGLPIIDPVVAMLVSLWIMKNAVEVFMEGNTELMDGGARREMYQLLFDTVRTVPGVSNPHRARIRKIANRWTIELDLEMDGDRPMKETHGTTVEVEKAIRDAIPEVYDLMIHVEPYDMGDAEPEQFGLSEMDVQ
jgi:cation diffusion facilitator family transporter